MEEKTSDKKDSVMVTLEAREKRLDVMKKIVEMRRAEERYKTEKLKEEVEIEKKELECDRLRKPDSFFELYMMAVATIIDEDKSIGSEVRYKNLFDENELRIIKSKILNKIKQL